MCICMCVCICMYLYMYASMYACMHVYMHVHVYIYIYVYFYVFISHTFAAKSKCHGLCVASVCVHALMNLEARRQPSPEISKISGHVEYFVQA